MVTMCTTFGPGRTSVRIDTPGAIVPSGIGEHGTDTAPAPDDTAAVPPTIVTSGQLIVRMTSIVLVGAHGAVVRTIGASRCAASGAAASASANVSPVATSASLGWLPPSEATAAAVADLAAPGRRLHV